jgi:hypothetical protein
VIISSLLSLILDSIVRSSVSPGILAVPLLMMYMTSVLGRLHRADSLHLCTHVYMSGYKIATTQQPQSHLSVHNARFMNAMPRSES